jgi:DNA-directed RNA polymerase specialized sigma24 family protein
MPHDDEHRSRQPGESAAVIQAREGAEKTVRTLVDGGDVLRAVAEAIRLYGAEIFGFLVGVLGDNKASRDVYATIHDRVLQDLPAFSWRCSLRTWTYAIARAELARHRLRVAPAPARPSQALASVPDPTTTISFRPTNMRSKIATLRACLQEEDRELLILRIDRRLDWQELAVTSLGENASRFEIERESTRLCARFALVRDALAESARQQRLLGPE